MSKYHQKWYQFSAVADFAAKDCTVSTSSPGSLSTDIETAIQECWDDVRHDVQYKVNLSGRVVCHPSGLTDQMASYVYRVIAVLLKNAEYGSKRQEYIDKQHLYISAILK